MKTEQIRAILEEVSKELKEDKEWEQQVKQWKKDKVKTTSEHFTNWLKKNRQDLVKKIARLSYKEVWEKGFINATIVWGNLMKE